jgi:uroporphyrinogen decarboxylase
MPEVIDPYQQVVRVEDSVLAWARADVLPVPLEPREWRIDVLPDGRSQVKYPALWRTVIQPDGSELAYNPTGKPIARRARTSWHFDPIDPPLAQAETVADVAKAQADIEAFDWPFFCDMGWDQLEARARRLHNDTPYALMGNFCAHVFAGAQMLRGFENFLVDLVANPALAEAIMDALVEAYVRRFDRYATAVGQYVQVINVNDDLGAQDAPLVSPRLYRQRIKPYHSKLYRFMKDKCRAAIFLHSDGAIAPLIPDLIDAGVDILNPIQVSARGMDPVHLKREFGKAICFWGAGCDTQQVLPFGTPQHVRDEVKRRLDILMPGGGFVFTTVHNIQPEVPPENIVAMYETVWEFGCY